MTLTETSVSAMDIMREIFIFNILFSCIFLSDIKYISVSQKNVQEHSECLSFDPKMSLKQNFIFFIYKCALFGSL